ncbi:hypothetical protein B9K06_25265 [Bacillus sp. OG2]|nr:hypothetical protein B9K06_25265 [Bacillus sp. OG2]
MDNIKILILSLPTILLALLLFLIQIFSLKLPVFYLNVGTNNGNENLFINLAFLSLLSFLLSTPIFFFHKERKLHFAILLLGTLLSLVLHLMINWLLLMISFNQQL